MVKRNNKDIEVNQWIGKMIQYMRIDCELSQTELGRKVGISTSEISRIENGTVGLTVWMLVRIGHALGRKMDLTFERNGNDSTVC